MVAPKYDLTRAAGVQKALGDGVGLFNPRLGEFYSAAPHLLREDGLSCVKGKVDAAGLEQAHKAFEGQDRLGQADMGKLLEENAESVSRRKPHDGKPLSAREAAFVAKTPGWLVSTPENVYGEPGLGLPLGQPGRLESRYAMRDAMEAQWRDVPFAEKRKVMADELVALGIDPAEKGNPMTRAQLDYAVSLWSGFEAGIPDEAMSPVLAGALSSKDMTQFISRAEAGWDGDGLPETHMGNMIAAAHERYAEAHGGEFVPVTEREDEAAGDRNLGEGHVLDVVQMENGSAGEENFLEHDFLAKPTKPIELRAYDSMMDGPRASAEVMDGGDVIHVSDTVCVQHREAWETGLDSDGYVIEDLAHDGRPVRLANPIDMVVLDEGLAGGEFELDSGMSLREALDARRDELEAISELSRRTPDLPKEDDAAGFDDIEF